MKNRLIATVAAAALALTSITATPATALSDSERSALTLFLGAAAVAALLNNGANKRHGTQSARLGHNNYNDDGYRYGKKKHHKKHSRKHRRHKMIPAQCVFPIRGANGRANVVSARCLSEFGRNRNLPPTCAFHVRDNWGRRTVYGAHCLEQNGFRIAGVR